MIDIQLQIEHAAGYADVLERAGQAVLQHMDTRGDASVVLADDEQLRTLNFQFLGMDAPTDVLSFPSGEVDPDTQEVYLGDVIISLPRATLQANERGHSIQDELALLVVHGMLHLLGYDHTEPEEKAIMWDMQANVLEQLGIRVSIPEN